MRRFVLKQNILRFREQLSRATDSADQRKLRLFIAEAEAELLEMERLSTRDSLHLDDRLQRLTESAIDAAINDHHADFGNIQLLDKDQKRLLFAAQRNLPLLFLVHFSTVKADDGSACARCLGSGASFHIHDVDVDDEYAPHRAVAIATGYRSVISAPLHDPSGAMLGVFSLLFREPRAFSDAVVAAFERQASATALNLHQLLSA